MAINGAHVLLYSNDAAATRAALRDLLGTRFVDDGQGWLIFALPPAEIGVHPAESHGHAVEPHHALSFMCDDIEATVAEVRAKGVAVLGEPVDEGYGVVVMLELPGDVRVQLYEPRHETAITP
jgi:predicted enzyme related to lactoylglutathione lyase